MENVDTQQTKNSIQGIPSIVALIVGLVLLLPLVWVLTTTRLQPLLTTLSFSTQDFNMFEKGEFVGSANFDRMAQDARYTNAIGFTTSFALTRTLIILLVAPLVGIMAGMGNFVLRGLNRLLLSIAAVLIAPVSMALLWSVYVGRLWGNDPSPIFSPDMPFLLANPATAPTSVLALDGIITLAVALAVGAAAFMAVVRGRASQHTGRAGVGLWLILGLLALLSVSETLVLPYLLTGGGPASATMTVPLSIYMDGFQRFRFGYATAQAVPLVVYTIPVVVLLWLVLVVLRLRLIFTPAPAGATGGCLSFFALPLIVVLALPAAGLVAVGVSIARSTDGFAALPATLNWNSALVNTIAVPWQTIWMIQIPVTWLAGMALGFFRPLGRLISNLIFLPALFLALLPAELLMLAWYDNLRQSDLLNTTAAFNLPWLVGGFALIVFRMFFDGTHDQYQAAVSAGQAAGRAFFRQVVLPSLPVALVVGAALSFASTQSLLWNLIVASSTDLYNIPLSLTMLTNQYGAETGVLTAAAVQWLGIGALIFVPVFWLLHLLVLDRLGIIAGAGGKQKADALFGEINSEPQRIDWS